MTGWTRVVAATGALIWALTGAAAAQDGRWYRAESPNFVVYGPGDRQVRAAAEALENFDATLRMLLSVQAPAAENKLDIYLVDNLDGLREVSPRLGNDVAGFYLPTSEYVAAFAIQDTAYGVVRRQILFHEYAHHFMLHYARRAYPRWYVEGWAEWVSTTEFRGRTAQVGRPSETRAQTLQAMGFMPMANFLAPERVERDARISTQQFYAQSWFAATYIGGRSDYVTGLNRYVNALSRGDDPITSFEPSFGVAPDQFASEMRMNLSRPVRVGQVALPGELPTISVTRLPRSADRLLLMTARLRFENDPQDARAAFATAVEAEASRFPDAAIAQRAAARAALWREDTAAARTRLAPVLAADENDVEARFLMGKSYLADARAAADPVQIDAAVRESRRQFVRAFRVDPNHFATLFNYATTFLTSQPMDEQNLNVLARAAELAPQADHIRMTLANELIHSERYDDAIVTLRPLMYAPHGGSYADRARVMTEAARRREAPPPWDESQAEEGDSGD